MSVIETLEEKLDRAIRNATEHARFSVRLHEDMAAIESKVAARLDTALASLAASADQKFEALKAELVGTFSGPSTEALDAFGRTVDALRQRSGSPAGPSASLPTDPDTNPGTVR